MGVAVACVHCKQEVALPFRDIRGRPVCGVCALQRLDLLRLLLRTK